MDKKIGLQTRHLAAKIQKVRDGNYSHKEIIRYLEKLTIERKYFIDQFKIFCLYLNKDDSFLKDEIPILTVEEAKKHVYLRGYVVSDFLLCCTYKVIQENPYIPPPRKSDVEIFVIMLQAIVNDLSWAIGELNAYLSNDL